MAVGQMLCLKEIHTFWFYSFPAAQIIQNIYDIVLRLHCNTTRATASFKITALVRTANKNNLETKKKLLPAH